LLVWENPDERAKNGTRPKAEAAAALMAAWPFAKPEWRWLLEPAGRWAAAYS
jgi:hypothetical protein